MLRNVLPLLLIVVLCSASPAQKTPGEKTPAQLAAAGKVVKAGDLEANLYLLNQWGERPQAIQDFYAAAYKLLEADPQASYADLGESDEIRRLAAAAGLKHLGGPTLGALTHQGARVWVRTLGPAKVEVRVKTPEGERSFGPVQSSAKTDMTAVVEVEGLEPATRYPYRVLIDGKEVEIPEHAALVTAPCPETAKHVRICFGTCPHVWGLGNQRQADRILSRKPSVMLFGGDVAAQDRTNKLGLHRADYLLRDLRPAWRDLAAAMPVYATWDDHDYFHNDLWGVPKNFTDADRRGVREVFRRAWNNPSSGLDGEGVFLRTRVGPCDVIMVDNRYFREGRVGSFLGEKQMKWLEAQLLDCRGPFIVLSCGTMWSDYVSNGKDSWGRWDPEGRERIFRLIEKNRIGGVLLISGDRHGARGFTIPRPGGFKFYEFEPGSLGGRHGPAAKSEKWADNQLFGISGKYAFGEFTVDAEKDDPEVTFRLIGSDDGKEIYKITLTRSQLTPPAQ